MQEGNRGKSAGTVLVIDNDSGMRALLRDFLEREGLRVLEEGSCEGAMATVESNRLDAVILDKEMPNMSGLDFLALLRRRWPDTPVILITAFGGPVVADEAQRRGAARYLEKPFRVTQLLEAIQTVTKTKEAGS